MMNYFLELGFRVQSTRFFGLGERVGNYILSPGTYTIMPSLQADFSFDQGTDGAQQGYGMHPLLMMQMKNGQFMGIYLANTYPMQVTIR